MNNHKRIAILDLGTNTFHLLICELRASIQTKQQNVIVFKKKQYVKLASGGIDYIEEAAWKRGMETLFHFKTIIDAYEVQEIYAFGTAGLRTAQNGNRFIETVGENVGINISLIDGEKEAELICRGVRQAVNLGSNKVLIMDIGGGSVEFIIADNENLYWKKSFPIGAAVLKNAFHKKEPFGVEGVLLLRQFFDAELYPVRDILKVHKCKTLIGASGTFDSIVDMQLAQENKTRAVTQKDAHLINIEYFNQLTAYLIKCNLQKRLKIPGMISERAEMIVVACVLIDYVIKEFDINNIIQSEFAMKQGILWEVLYGES